MRSGCFAAENACHICHDSSVLFLSLSLKLQLSLISMRFPVLYVQSCTYKGPRRSILGHAGDWWSLRGRRDATVHLHGRPLSGPARSPLAGT
jgi:hypothetical protein